jgi:hypothetical protein
MRIEENAEEVQSILADVRGGVYRIFSAIPSIRGKIAENSKKRQDWCDGAIGELETLRHKLRKAINLVNQIKEA